MFIGNKRNNKNVDNVNLYIELTNTQAILMIKKEYLYLRSFVANGFQILSKDELGLYKDSMSKLKSFLWWCENCNGLYNKSVLHVFTYNGLKSVCEVCCEVAKFYSDLETFEICNKFYNYVCNYISVDDLVKSCVTYLVNLLQQNNIEPFILQSNSSSSFYLKPDVLLSGIRISDHNNPNYRGGYNCVCGHFKSTSKATRTDSNECITVYLSQSNYKQRLNDLVNALVTERENILLNHSVNEYNKLKYQEAIEESSKGYQWLDKGIESLLKLFERER